MRFNFPLDYDLILRKKRSIKRNLLEQDTTRFIQKKIAILGGSSTAEIKDFLEIFLLDLGILPQFYESEYNKYYEDAIFGTQELEEFKPDIIYLHTSFVNLHFASLGTPITKENKQNFITQNCEKFLNIWKALERFNGVIIQNNFELPPHRLLGNLDCLQGRVGVVQELNIALQNQIEKYPRVYLHDLNYLSSMLGLERYYDKSLFYQAKYAMSMESMIEIAFSLSRLIGSLFGKSKKALVLDLDNTCWGGVIGDDGLMGISIGDETALGEGYSAFQQYALDLKNRGVILAVCSKNEIENAKEGFSHPRSILHVEDFACFMANWNPKNENIALIAKTLNIGEDSLVFVDDNPSEREIVRSQLSSVSVPEVGDNVIDYITHLDRNYFFETPSLSQDDLKRSEYYLQNSQRLNEQSSFKSYEEFLQSLCMQAEILEFSPIYLERITQLINKTNQFNCTTKRYDFGMVESMSKDEKYICLYGKLVDKYGDNGLIAISIGRIVEDVCHLDLWLMSCRVLKRHMEYAMLDSFVEIAKKRGVKKLVGYYFKSPKNQMVANLYEDFGFDLVFKDEEQSLFELELKNYKNKNFIIGVNHDK
ncbi:HAD-IIIC family phosphatase [Helicobacter anatolicus]|uniref:HAD-IIIC family phosphatase n=1 Tax=Helicobacter anatolicus TaxID=2905874 RepID=UPI001E4FBE98|nr:HAD-IIIC family phosphatase [Helicobacter anatolicus]MCE3038665.1 HAD-IIIC family phosphatase [Helicobacter anatolicus]